MASNSHSTSTVLLLSPILVRARARDYKHEINDALWQTLKCFQAAILKQKAQKKKTYPEEEHKKFQDNSWPA